MVLPLVCVVRQTIFGIKETSTKRLGGKGYLIVESIIKVRLLGELCCDGEKFSFVVDMKNGSIVSFSI